MKFKLILILVIFMVFLTLFTDEIDGGSAEERVRGIRSKVTATLDENGRRGRGYDDKDSDEEEQIVPIRIEEIPNEPIRNSDGLEGGEGDGEEY